jgi:hypothetical protein
VRAWREIESGPAPSLVEVLKPEKRKSAVFRLTGAGLRGETVIAKRRPRGDLDFELRMYVDVLPSLPLPTLEVFGFVEAADDQSWIFLEDAGELWYSPTAEEHRRLAVQWLADLHTRSSDWSALLPDTGLTYFRSVAEAAIDSVVAGREHPGLSHEDAWVLQAIEGHVDAIAAHWDEVEAACADSPLGLVHGDFVPKNLRVCDRGAEPELISFDWETAGAASPAADLAMLPDDDRSLWLYHTLVRGAWPGLSWEDVRLLERTGSMFRVLHCVQWEARSFRWAWIDRATRRMAGYERRLREIVEWNGWSP